MLKLLRLKLKYLVLLASLLLLLLMLLIPSSSYLVNKTDYDAKISDIEPKYFTTSDYNKFTVEILNAKITEKELVDKSDISGFIDNSDLDKTIATLLPKAELKAEQDKIGKFQAFFSSYFRLFEDDGTQNYLVFQPIYKYFKKIANSGHISAWKSKGLSDESIKLPGSSNNSVTPELNYISIKPRVKFDGSCLKQNKIRFTPKKSGEYVYCL